jgi:LacI family transcriptional regulator
MPMTGKKHPGATAQPASPAKTRYTIRDVARLAGVSRSTISLALNDSPKINTRTKERVLALIAEIGYRPSQVARNLVRQCSGTICIVLPKIDHVFSDYYFSESLSGIGEALTERGLLLMVQLATDEFKDTRRALTLFRQGDVDGLLCVGNLTTDLYLAELANAGCPLMLVNSELGSVPNVIAGNRAGAVAAVKHLHALGHRRIAHIRGSEFVTTAIHRTEGYLQAMRELGLSVSEDMVAVGYFDQKSGYSATQWLLSRPERPTAIFTTNDMMAIGACEACHDAGLRVPQDVAIFGGDDILLAQYVTPTLSTLRQSMYVVGRTACEQLCRQLAGEPFQTSVEIPCETVIRQSCGAPAK